MPRSSTRQHIVEVASDLFYRNGYNRTGINEVIAESGIAKATLYNHFRSKDEICIAYLQYKHEVFVKDIKAYCDTRPANGRQVLAIFDFLEAFFQDRDFNGCWCIKTVAEIPREDERIRKEIQKQKNQLINFIESLLMDIKDEDERRDTARQIYLLYESAVSESHLHQADWPITSAKAIASKIIG